MHTLHRTILLSATLGMAVIVGAQPVSDALAPLGLLRLRDRGGVDGASKLPAGKVQADSLEAVGSDVVRAEKRGIDYLVLSPEREWLRPLRGGAREEVTFVSFSVYASLSTIIRVGDAWLGVIEASSQGSAQLVAGHPGKEGIDWQPLGYQLRVEAYDGKPLAALPVLTVRLDPKAGVWDLYSDARLVAEGLPLYQSGRRQDAGEFYLRGGKEGAYILGLVMADENPLYTDANANGIDDRFEQRSRGELLPADASAAERKTLAQAWRADARVNRPPSLLVPRLLPDRLAAAK